MRSKKTLLNDARLYLILDRQVNSYTELFEIAEKTIAQGVDIIQLRDKNGSDEEILDFSKQVLELTTGRIPYIVNDRVDLAVASGASGVHLGQEDMDIGKARKIMGDEAIIGISCQTLAQAQKAAEDGADYIGFGSVFKTLTKPERNPMDMRLLKRVITDIAIPVFSIGGIDLQNITQLKPVGIRRIAVCRAVCQAKNAQDVVRQFKEALG